MMTHTERLRLVVRFAAMDLKASRPGDLMNLRDDLRAFFPVFTGFNKPIASTAVGSEDLTLDALKKLQDDVRRILELAVEQHPTDEPAGSKLMSGRSSTVDVHVKLSLATQTENPGLLPAMRSLLIHGTWRDVFLMALVNMIWGEPVNRLRRCPECGDTFVRVRRQVHCGPVCSSRANTRRWRERAEVQPAASKPSKTGKRKPASRRR